MAFDQFDMGHGFARRDSGHLVLVQVVGTGSFAPWGFTIWRDGRCVAGAVHMDWTAFDAQAEADKALAAQVAMDGGRAQAS